ncbi:MAG: LPS-assembly protein LptD [Sphingobacteriales bacterium]|nr:LPS-assembly protein LptD [Sphingobacteriales bacterium]
MKQLYKFRSIYFFILLFTVAILCTVTWKTSAAHNGLWKFDRFLTVRLVIGTDTTKPVIKTDTTAKPGIDTSGRKEKIDTFSLKISKDSLDAPLKYSAEDSAVVLIQDKKILLYGKTKTDYKDITLTAPKVEVDQQTQVVTAVNRKDSTGEIIETAHFKSGESEFSSDTIRYNFKTQIGLTKNTYTQDGEIFVHGDQAKKVNETTTFIRKARFTTCNLDDPHFAFVTPKMKVINKKLAVSGPAHPEFEGVPVPVYLPFGFYPLSQGRHSGLLPPHFATNEQYGLGLEGLGYYKVISNYWDVRFYGNLYSYGGWTFNVNPTYRKRYRYSGTFTFSVQNTKLNFKGDPDFLKNRSYNISWNHSVDGKARPGTSFSANVNAGSTKFNELVPNSTQRNFQNQLGSSIAYSKSWAGKPYNLTISANHNQNNLTRLINLNLPDAGFSVSTLYPFQKKESVGATKWYEKLGIGYNGNFRNQVSFYDTAFRLKQLIDTLQWGAQHNFPLSVALPPIAGGAIIVSPGVSWSQVWIAQKFRRTWNPATKKVDTSITKGFFMDNQVAFSLSLNTAIFGTYQFKKSRIVAIRHVIRPSFAFNYRPDLSKKHFYKTQVDTTGNYFFEFSEFEGALYSGFSKGRTGGISFQLDNNLEMKWRSKKDTGDNAIKKVKLIDGYGFSTAYNFLADSMKLSFFSLYLRTTLFEKISITAYSILDPYQTDERGRDINKYAWQGGGFKPGRLTTGSISISSNFQSKPRDSKKEEQRKKNEQLRLSDPDLAGDQQRLLEYMQQNPSEFVDFNIPWRISFGYSLSFTNRLKSDFSGFEKDFSSNINLNGGFNLTPKWNFSANGFYDFDTKKLQTFSMSISREMHCWQMSINITPVGLYKYFSFSINPKAAVLQDLKINRTRSFPNF